MAVSLLLSAHRVVIFAIAQLSCFIIFTAILQLTGLKPPSIYRILVTK